MKTVIINGIEMSYEQAHRMLWNWLADNPRYEKRDFFEQNKCNRDILHYCFACDLRKEYEEDGCFIPDCSRCPIKWGTEDVKTSFYCEGDEEDEELMSLYDKWYEEYRDWETDRKSTRLNSSHSAKSRMPSSA